MIFTFLSNLMYIFAFPIKNDRLEGNLFNLYKTLMVFNIISAAIVICQMAQGVRRIQIEQPELGKEFKKQGAVVLVANIIASINYYMMGQGILIFGHLSFIPCLFSQLSFYFLTETLPLIAFIKLQNKLVSLHGLDPAEPRPEEPAAAADGANNGPNAAAQDEQ